MRKQLKYTLKEPEKFNNKLLAWSQQYREVVWLDSNNYSQEFSSFDSILAVDAFTSIQTDTLNAFNKIKDYQEVTKDWLFGYLTYDLKNDTEALNSQNYDGLKFPDLFFFQPKKVFLLKGDLLEMHYLKCVEEELETDFETISNFESTYLEQTDGHEIKIKLRIHKEDYFNKVNALLEHIHRGDIYEVNFCQEFYAEETTLNPLLTYLKLNKLSKPPFATFLKLNDKFLLSASPERYLKKTGSKVISQPIKGTAKRSENSVEDELLKRRLANDSKEQSENIMIVDLVRNDLSRVAKKGTVLVEELCKVYTFEQVHQLISTVSCDVESSINPVEIIKNSFPMGSMTGAPKISAMELIETYEETKRGLYSGTVGYFTPSGDFDFNVVIRSILYNQSKHYVSYSVGGAITAKSDPLKEYEECLVKAKAMREVLEN